MVSRVDPAFLKERERDSCFVLSNDDIARVSTVSTIDFLEEMNAKVTKKPVTLLANESTEKRAFVSSADLYRARRYTVDRVKSLSDIHPAMTADEIKCPSCGHAVKNNAPRYLLPPCPKGCPIHASRWVILQQGVVDMASGFLTIRDKKIGTQTIRFYIDTWNLQFNNNYMNLADANASSSQVTVDAIPVVNYTAPGETVFSLWITAVYPVKEEKQATRAASRFIVDVEPTGEKETVHAIFFRNLDFMRMYMGFKEYYLQTGFPDMIVVMNDGTKRVVEFEYDSKNFDAHGHPAHVTDFIICWKHGRNKDDGIRVIELQKLNGKELIVA
jgi:hypothetical protein